MDDVRGHEVVLTSTHNLCFRATIRKKVFPGKPQFYYIKVGCKGVYITRICYHNVYNDVYPVFVMKVGARF